MTTIATTTVNEKQTIRVILKDSLYYVQGLSTRKSYKTEKAAMKRYNKLVS